MNVQEQLTEWSEAFSAGEMTVEDVQEKFASLRDDEVAALPPELRKAVIESRQTLDSIRYGMCEAGQRGEIAQVFGKLSAISDQRSAESK